MFTAIRRRLIALRAAPMPDVRRARYKQQSRRRLHANGFALLPIEAGAIREAWPFHVSADARKEEDAQPDQGMILAAWPRSSGARQFCARCVFLNSMFEMRNCGFGPTKLWLWAN